MNSNNGTLLPTPVPTHSLPQYHGNHTLNEFNMEIQLDLRGRRHIEKQDNADGVYLMQEGTGSSLRIFPVPGRASAQAFRKFLDKRLPHNLVTDEYGCVTPIEQVSDDHLPILQAQLWLNRLCNDTEALSNQATAENGAKKCIPFFQRRSVKMLQSPGVDATIYQLSLLASHFEFIVGLLQSDHIFIHGKQTNRACEFPMCKHQANAQSLAHFTVILEPLVHWGSVTLASDLLLCRGRVQVFRRDGEKRDDPLWAQAIMRLCPPSLPAYCSHCLELLMDNRMRVMAFLGKADPTFMAVNPQPAHMGGIVDFQIDEETCEGSNVTYQTAAGENGRQVSWDGIDNRNEENLLFLDGPFDKLPNQPLHKASIFHCLNSSHDNKAPSSCSESSTPVSTTLDQGTVPRVLTGSSTWNSVNKSSSVPSPPGTNRIHSDTNSQSTPMHDYSTLNVNDGGLIPANKRKFNAPCAKISSTLLRGTGRVFGRELDCNTTNLRAKPTRTTKGMNMPVRYNSAEVFNIQDFLSPALDTAEEIRSKSPSLVPPNPSPKYDHSDDSDSTKPEESGIWASYIKHAAKPFIVPSTNPKSPPKKKSQPRPNGKKALTKDVPIPGPFFAKRPQEKCPQTISPPTWTAHHQRIPSEKEIICHCRQPRGPNTPIAQCSHPSCTIHWFHYSCLSKPAKISSRHGRLICAPCKTTMHFHTLDAQNNHTQKTFFDQHLSVPFSASEILAAMPGPGGAFGIPDPYGFATVLQTENETATATATATATEDQSACRDKGALGDLRTCGHVRSMPFMLAEAYLNPRAYAYLHEVVEEDDEEMYDFEEYEDGEEYEFENYEDGDGHVHVAADEMS